FTSNIEHPKLIMKTASSLIELRTILLQLTLACLLPPCLTCQSFRPKSFPVRAAVDPSVWRLVWSDEFNAADKSPIDATRWTAQVGGHGWGNQELEYYTNRID